MGAAKRLPLTRPVAATATRSAAAPAVGGASGFARGNGAMLKLFRKAKNDEPCPECEGKLHRKAGNGRDPGDVPPIVYDVLRSPGQPLAEGVRTDMETRFGGADFSGVRLHTDRHAAESASAVNATAFAVGNHVVLGEGVAQYAGGRGQRALVHELTHVVQHQAAGGQLAADAQSLRIVPSNDPAERQAEQAAATLHGSPTAGGAEASQVTAAAPGALARLQHPICLEKWNECVAGGWVPTWKCTDCLRYCDAQDGNWPDHWCPPRRGYERVRELVPSWILYLLGAAALAALVACFATGVCEVGIIVGGASVAVAAALLLILKQAGLVSGDTVADNQPTEADPPETSAPDPEAVA